MEMEDALTRAEKRNGHKREEEDSREKLPYPKGVFFIIGNEFCERFCYYGLRTLLFLYLKNVLLYTPADATSINHGFVFLSYFFPLAGAFLADSLLGKYWTILSLSLVYSLGSVTLSVGSIADYGIPAKELSILGLFLIAVGTGGIKPCVSSFGGDQFQLPEQERHLSTFFSIFYFSINFGSVLSTYITPVLKQEVACFGSDTCYPLAFGVPSALMILSTVIFVCGRPFYQIKKPEGNIIFMVFKCIKDAVCAKFKSKSQRDSSAKKTHWLDLVKDQYPQGFTEDVKAVLAIMMILIPLPVFWALFDQQTSRWVGQAELMDGQLGSWTILPEQMMVLNPLLILIFIPIFNYVIYPLLTSCRLLQRPLQRMTVGGILAGVAFVMSAFIQLNIESDGGAVTGLHMYNGLNCEVKLNVHGLAPTVIGKASWTELPPQFNSTQFSIQANCLQQNKEQPLTSLPNSTTTVGYVITSAKDKPKLLRITDPKLNPTETPELRIIYQVDWPTDFTLSDSDKVISSVKLQPASNEAGIVSLQKTSYNFLINGTKPRDIDPLKDGVNILLLLPSTLDEPKGSLLKFNTKKPIHMLWQVPQIMTITMAEVMLSVTGLEFAYTQAPLSMKSVVQSLYLLTTAIGNVLVVFIAQLKLFKSVAYELFLFGGLMFLDMLLFIILAVRYKYRTYH